MGRRGAGEVEGHCEGRGEGGPGLGRYEVNAWTVHTELTGPVSRVARAAVHSVGAREEFAPVD